MVLVRLVWFIVFAFLYCTVGTCSYVSLRFWVVCMFGWVRRIGALRFSCADLVMFVCVLDLCAG